MSAQLKKLQEKRLELATELREKGEKPEAWNAEDQAEWERLNKAYDETKNALDAENKRLEEEAAQREAVANRLKQLEADDKVRRVPIGNDGARLDDVRNDDKKLDRDQQFALALQGWMLNKSRFQHEIGEQHHNAAKALGIRFDQEGLEINLANSRDFRNIQQVSRLPKNALAGYDGPAGGFTFGETFVNRLEMAMLAYGGMMRVAEVIRTGTGEPIRWPIFDDTDQTGVQISEGGGTSAGTNPTIGQVVWNAYDFSSKSLLVSYQLLRDSVFDLPSVIGDMLGERLGRVLNTAFTTGTGAATPKGIVNCAAAGVTTASATAIKYDELIELEHSIDPSRRNMPGVGYMFHDNVLLYLRKVKDGEGRYLWQAGANSGAPDLLNGRPYTINQDMSSTITSTDITVLFGQLSQYKIRQVGNIRLHRLVEKYRDSADQDAFVAFVSADGNLLDAGDNPVKKLTQKT